MAVNVRVLQAAVALAVLDSNYQRLLLTDRAAALQMLPHQPCMPPIELTIEDRDAFERLPTSSFEALSEGVRQLKLAARRVSHRDDGGASALHDTSLAFAS
jgi:hypothetical protein